MSSPTFSVVMPTRNRADLLYYSLKSAQAQDFDDFEILVSNNYSSDETEKVVLDNLDSYTHYISTDKPLSMPDHWEFALAHAKGKYILYLCDDDALRPDLLAFLFNVIKKKDPYCISWMNADYVHLDWYDKSARNSLYFGTYTYTHKVNEYNSTTLLRDYFDAKLEPTSIKLPKMLNSCCHRQVFSKIKRIVGRTFLSPCPDHSVALAILASIPKFLHVESPLFLAGVSRKGIGANFNRKNEVSAAFWDEFSEKSKTFIYTPLKNRINPNPPVESILRVKAAMPDQLNQFSLNLVNYFIECKKGIEKTRKYNNDVTAEIEEFYTVLEEQDKKVREVVLAAIETDMQQRYASEKDVESEGFQNNILRRLKDKLPISLKKRLAKIRQEILSIDANDAKKNKKDLNQTPGRIYGSEAGFSNIAECAVKLKEMFPLPEIES